MLNIPVILGSSRDGRQSLHPASFLLNKIKALGHDAQVVDFKTLPLPFMESSVLPSQLKMQYENPNVQQWSDIAFKADAFVIVTPEYNHSYPAVLKNALDWLYEEFKRKPVALVGISSGRIGGARAIEHLRPVLENFSMFAIRETVLFGPIKEAFNDQGELINGSYEKQVDGLLVSLVYSGEALKNHSLLNTK